jgi:hypothetical protein
MKAPVETALTTLRPQRFGEFTLAKGQHTTIVKFPLQVEKKN